jgi:hypothetical protein
MNTKSISAIVVIAAMVAVIPAFMVPANAQFNTNNAASQSSSQSQNATNTGGAGGVAVLGGSANGGSASSFQAQNSCQQAAQSGAFGSSNNTIPTNC